MKMKRALPFLAILCSALSGCGLFRGTTAKPVAPPAASAAAAAPWWQFRGGEGGDASAEADSKTESGRMLRSQLAKGRGLEQTGQLEEARAVYVKLIDKFPDRPEAFHRLAIVADRQRRHTEAQRHYERALELRGEDAQLFNDLGYCHFLQGNLPQAEQLLTYANRLSPNTPRFHNNLGMVLGHQGRHQEALREFMQAGSEADAFYNLAFVYASQDQAEQAKECFRKALVIDPTHQLAAESLRSFEIFDEDMQARGLRPYDMPADSEMVRYEEIAGGYGAQGGDGGGYAAGHVQNAGHEVRMNATARQQTRTLQTEARTRAIQMRAESPSNSSAAEQQYQGYNW